MSKSMLLLLLAAAPCLGQESEPPRRALESAGAEKAPPSPHELLAAALLDYRKQRELVLDARVVQKQPEAQPQAPGANGAVVQVVIQGPGGATPDPYEGDAEAWRDEEGNTVIVSRKELPGFGLFISPERTIQRVTSEGKTPGTDELRTELLSLMDGERFTDHVMLAKLEHRVDEQTGEHVWRGKVDKEIVRPVRAEGVDPRIAQIVGGMRPRVLRADLELRITKEGRLARATVTIVRNDPAREMMARGGFGGAGQIILRNGKLQQQEKEEGDAEKHDIEGVSSVYTLDFTRKAPSERATAFKREITRALREE